MIGGHPHRRPVLLYTNLGAGRLCGAGEAGILHPSVLLYHTVLWSHLHPQPRCGPLYVSPEGWSVRRTGADHLGDRVRAA